jgi:LmbE family N-acetylglucosaminyl deacetylase
MIKRYSYLSVFLWCAGLSIISPAVAQNAAAPKNSAELYAQIKSLGVVGSVLYIAAHPDDENNSFLPYLVKERNLRTAYLSLTRGDGGQNLIGKEQGIELGMIRTQELLAARRQDGAEQYFSTAYEFGFSKSAEEALKIWDHQKVLSDVVWVIRKFQPDIIITRFPGDARAGHGHHAASSIIANEAYLAAADPNQFPEQLQKGVTVWKAKRILWNTFNFGSINTTNNNQLKIEVGGYNPILAKSYGEIGAEARTMHKSQGEGRPRRRGPSYEFFETTGGEAPTQDLMDGIVTNWTRFQGEKIQNQVNQIVNDYQLAHPELSVSALVSLYQSINSLTPSVWKTYKLNQVQGLIQDCAGILMEATTQQQQVIPGQSLSIQLLLNQRSAVKTTIDKIVFPFSDSNNPQNSVNQPIASNQQALTYNQNIQLDYKFTLPTTTAISQPYWLVQPKTEGMFIVNDYALIGKAENDPAFSVAIQLQIEGQAFNFNTPVYYKYTDPTKGDQYQPIVIVPAQEVKYDKEVYLTAPGKSATVSLCCCFGCCYICNSCAIYCWISY